MLTLGSNYALPNSRGRSFKSHSVAAILNSQTEPNLNRISKIPKNFFANNKGSNIVDYYFIIFQYRPFFGLKVALNKELSCV